MPVRTRNARANGYPPFYDFETQSRTRMATLLGQAYFLEPPPGYEWDLEIVKRIRSTFDHGLVPIHRVMVFRAVTGGEIRCHNWGVGRYSQNGKHEEAPWKQQLLAGAPPPSNKYLASLERPNVIDTWYPIAPMNNMGLPPEWQPLDELALQDLRDIDAFRRSFPDEKDALKAYNAVQKLKEEERTKAREAMLAAAEEKLDDRLHTSNTPSTSKTKPTGRPETPTLAIQEYTAPCQSPTV